VKVIDVYLKDKIKEMTLYIQKTKTYDVYLKDKITQLTVYVQGLKIRLYTKVAHKAILRTSTVSAVLKKYMGVDSKATLSTQIKTSKITYPKIANNCTLSSSVNASLGYPIKVESSAVLSSSVNATLAKYRKFSNLEALTFADLETWTFNEFCWIIIAE